MFDSMKTLLPGVATSRRVKTYAAPSLSECLLLAKQELGSDAVIINTKTVRKNALLGRWGGRDMVQVTFGFDPASVTSPDSSRLPAPSPNGTPPMPSLSPSSLAGKETEKPGDKPAKAVPGWRKPLETPSTSIPAGPARPHAVKENILYPALLQQLLDADVAKPLAQILLAELRPGLPPHEAQTELRGILCRHLRIADNVKARNESPMQIIALVGPTGAGKTTTLAKLMARGALTERRRVGVVTLDTQRFAAAQQLQSLGELLQVPVRVAHDKADLIMRLTNFAAQELELVLIDTPGLSPNDMPSLAETAKILQGMDAVQRLLAVPATLTMRDMENSIARFQKFFCPDSLVLTKLDEAADHTCLGRMLSLQEKYELPLAYLTTGQWVPDDIALPDVNVIASRILSLAVT